MKMKRFKLFDAYTQIKSWVQTGKVKDLDISEALFAVVKNEDYDWIFGPHGLSLFKALLIRKSNDDKLL